MATKVHYVKKCRVDNPAVKRGEPYYWWKLPMGEKQYSATYPKRSQLTNSDYLGCVFDLQDSLEEHEVGDDLDFEDVLAEVREQVEEIKDQCQINLDNMKENLHAAPNGRLLIARLKVLDDAISELDSLDYSDCMIWDDEAEEKVFSMEPISKIIRNIEITRVGRNILLYGEEPPKSDEEE